MGNQGQSPISPRSCHRATLVAGPADGANYDQVSVEVICDIFWDLYDDYGAKVWFDFFGTFTPVDEPLPVTLDTAAKQATWVVAAASATAGQDLRTLFAGTYGFPIDNDAWPAILAAVQTRIAARSWSSPGNGDFDCDGDVDLVDLAHMVACLNGPGQPYGTSGCRVADFDNDQDVDMSDVAVFQSSFSIPN